MPRQENTQKLEGQLGCIYQQIAKTPCLQMKSLRSTSRVVLWPSHAFVYALASVHAWCAHARSHTHNYYKSAGDYVRSWVCNSTDRVLAEHAQAKPWFQFLATHKKPQTDGKCLYSQHFWGEGRKIILATFEASLCYMRSCTIPTSKGSLGKPACYVNLVTKFRFFNHIKSWIS